MLELSQNAKYFNDSYPNANAVSAGIMIESRAFSDPSAPPVCRSMALIRETVKHVLADFVR